MTDKFRIVRNIHHEVGKQNPHVCFLKKDENTNLWVKIDDKKKLK